MKCYLLLIASSLFGFAGISQTGAKITSVTAPYIKAATSTTYFDATPDTTYKWGVDVPYDSVANLTNFIAGVVPVPYTYTPTTGIVALRRQDNTGAVGSVSLVWAETVITPGPTLNILANYENDLEIFLKNQVYNKGADNLFDNTAPNHTNVERLDWIIASGYTIASSHPTATPDKVGFPVLDRGSAGSHDKFCIAAITSLDGTGLPTGYGNLVRVVATDYGDIGPNVLYRVLKGTYPFNLFDVSGNTQNRGGVFISFQDLGISASTTIYGYSLFAADLPISTTSADLVDYTNITFFPHNTNAANGGLDLIAVTGIAVADAVLPTRFITFNAVENNDIVNLNWTVENEISVNKYDVERSTDGIHYVKVHEILPSGNSSASKTYSVPDNVAGVLSVQLFYRIKQYDQDGSSYYSNTIPIRRNNKTASILVYPNPASDFIYVNIASTSNDKGILSVTNSAGARVTSQQIKLFNGNNSFAVDRFRGLPAGVYQLSIKLDSGRTIVKQFSKQ
ncbi:MAG: T9SS type A sorting domain-containing protein [Ginsengibacter sp.]